MVPELYYENVPESLYARMYGYYTTQGYLMCRQKLTFHCNFKCKICLARYDHQYLICEESSNTMTRSEKNGSNTCMTFSTHKQKFPSKKAPFIGGTLTKICMICTFRWADTDLCVPGRSMQIMGSVMPYFY